MSLLEKLPPTAVSLTHLKRRGAALVGLILLVSLAFASVAGASPARQAAASLSLSPAEISQEAGEQFDVMVSATGVSDLGGFELTLRFDPALIQIDGVEIGAFIGSTGRTVVPLGPEVDRENGQIQVGALTTGSAAGPGGEGALVTLRCTALRAGTGELALASAILTTTAAEPVEVTTAGAEVTFTGDVVVPTATFAPTTPTQTPVMLPTQVPSPTPLTPTATGAPTDTPIPSEPTSAPTEGPTLEPAETRIVRIATATAAARRTLIAEGVLLTPTPTATWTPEITPEPTAEPGEEVSGQPSDKTVVPAAGETSTPIGVPTGERTAAAVTPGGETESEATPLVSEAATEEAGQPERSSNPAGLALVGGGVVVIGVGLFLWLRARRREV